MKREFPVRFCERLGLKCPCLLDFAIRISQRISQRINQKLQKSLPVFHRFFADPKNKIGTVLKLKMN
jgi:hypothetical protein